jgi:hypothetical protein
MIKAVVLFSAWICLATTANAQPKILKGWLLDSATLYPISGATIKNSESRKTTLTDAAGFFAIGVSPNDVIYAIATGYHYDTLRYSPLMNDTVTLRLSPSGRVLPGVTVYSMYTRYQLDSLQRKTEYEQARGTKKKTFSAPGTGFGIGFNLDRIGNKKHKYQKRNAWLFALREQQAYIDYRFPPAMVAAYTGLKGEALRKFMYLYTPGYGWLRQHPDNEALLIYINEKLKLYKVLNP